MKEPTFRQGMCFYSKHLVNKQTNKQIPIWIVEVKPETNELLIVWGRDNYEI